VAVVLTVHGTNATGPAEGEAWWQLGSDFFQDIRRYVEGADGVLEFTPFIWNGANSETSRYAAGKMLYEQAKALDSRNEAYCLIGHSHGGSVIAHALTVGVSKPTTRLQGLSSWMTVGTPFIQMQRRRFLFSRLTPLGRSAYLALAIFALNPISAAIDRMAFLRLEEWHEIFDVLFWASIVPLALMTLAFFQPEKLKALTNRYANSVMDQYARKWIAFLHGGDEAVYALGQLRFAKFSFFQSDFVQQAMGRGAVYALPIALLVAISVPAFGDFIWAILKGIQRYLGDPIGSLLERLGSAIALPFRGAAWLLGMTVDQWQANNFFTNLVATLGLCLGLAAAAVITSLFFRLLGLLCGSAGSRFLNNLTTRQVQMAAWGSDSFGEHPSGADLCPHWISQTAKFLPAELSSEISLLTDQAAASSISKWRAKITQLASSSPGIRQTDFWSGYFSWNELIHTSYFTVPRFRKLVCFAVAHSQGFKPSEELRRDPEYALMSRWLEQIQR
jgi:hypothetical protein